MAGLWKLRVTPDDLNARSHGTLAEHLGIRFTGVEDDVLRASMPVDHRTKQPMGLLHGGASAVLAETLGSVAATLCVNQQRQYCVGIAINANHLRAVRDGFVHGAARPVHVGRTTQVWQIDIKDDAGHAVAVSQLTLAVLDR